MDDLQIKFANEGNQLDYSAKVIVRYEDYFGVNTDDFAKSLNIIGANALAEYNYRGGVLAQWILQHQYGIAPHRTVLTYQMTVQNTVFK